MKQLIATLFTVFFCCATMNAQTIVDDLQKEEAGKGKVKVKHSKEIDELVNGGKKVVVQQSTPAKQPERNIKKQDEQPKEPATSVAKEKKPEQKPEEPAKEVKRETVKRPVQPTETESENKVVDTNRKKIMRNAQKITGYRVQVFSGGSSRQDRQKAQEASNRVKAKFPDLPVYVHFYSPSWKCRVGNFRSYNEASKVLKQIKALGYSQACIVKGKITVQ